MVKYIYIQSEKKGQNNCISDLWTVGFYDPSGEWIPESDHTSKEDAINRVVYLNTGEVFKGTKTAFNHKHTAGEWHKTTDGEANFYGVALDKDWLMRVQQNGKLSVIEQEANMRLIENAPRLLEIAEMYYDSLKGKPSIAGKVVEETLRKIGVID